MLSRDHIAALGDGAAAFWTRCWGLFGRDGQQPPPGPWRTWLILGGRGFGKTWAGAEWVRQRARRGNARIALVGAIEAAVRDVMIEGPSGLIAIADDHERPVWQSSRGRLVWPSGAQAFVHSGANANSLRGPEFDYAWGDEIAKWEQAEAAWTNLQLGLRRGRAPRAVVTTTPRPVPLLRTLVRDPATAVTRGATSANDLLAPAYARAMAAAYAGTRIGRQELEGELIDDVEGALRTRALCAAAAWPRGLALPPMVRVVVGVDPPASATGDACGIVAVGAAADGRAFVLADASVTRASPERWARAVADTAASHGADRVVAEANNGGDMVASVLRSADSGLPVTLVHAARGKVARAEPVAILYERSLVHHVGSLSALEDELCGLLVGGGYEGPGRSPDRADALVWALSALMLAKRRVVRVR